MEKGGKQAGEGRDVCLLRTVHFTFVFIYVITKTFSVLYSLHLLSSVCVGCSVTHDFHSRKSEFSAVEIYTVIWSVRVPQVVLLVKFFECNTDPLERDTRPVIVTWRCLPLFKRCPKSRAFATGQLFLRLVM